jgi:hypothetical protein
MNVIFLMFIVVKFNFADVFVDAEYFFVTEKYFFAMPEEGLAEREPYFI